MVNSYFPCVHNLIAVNLSLQLIHYECWKYHITCFIKVSLLFRSQNDQPEVYADQKAEERYLDLQQLGIVLQHISIKGIVLAYFGYMNLIRPIIS